MENSSTIHIEGIGAVFFQRSRRARRIVITVSPAKGVRVAVPRRASFQRALEFVQLKKRWVQEHAARMEQISKQRKAFEERGLPVDRVAAKARLVERLNHLAKKFGFVYNKVALRHQKTRWGSCSYQGNISLNLKLALLPQELVDYVLLHELVHTRVHNHSPRFWSELEKYVDNARGMARRLRKDSLSLA